MALSHAVNNSNVHAWTLLLHAVQCPAGPSMTALSAKGHGVQCEGESIKGNKQGSHAFTKLHERLL